MFRTSSAMDKSVERAEIVLEEGQLGQPECRLCVRLHCQHGVVRTRHLFYEVCEPFHAIYNKQACRNQLRIASKTLGDWITHFLPRLDELTLVCTTNGMKLRSFMDAYDLDPDDGRATLRTELSIDMTEFERYSIAAETELTFSLKEFKAIVSLAEALNMPLSAHFERGGSPALFSVSYSDVVVADFIVSTLAEGSTTHAHSDTSSQVDHTAEASAPERRLVFPSSANSHLPSTAHPLSQSAGTRIVESFRTATALSSLPLIHSTGTPDGRAGDRAQVSSHFQSSATSMSLESTLPIHDVQPPRSRIGERLSMHTTEDMVLLPTATFSATSTAPSRSSQGYDSGHPTGSVVTNPQRRQQNLYNNEDVDDNDTFGLHPPAPPSPLSGHSDGSVCEMSDMELTGDADGNEETEDGFVSATPPVKRPRTLF
ncbi:Rad9-domain-containing protein [Thamnocephalis sphaerospora]|uniref:Rad9-domain-containing protein n=1 Tax=Thamnocephalis sphaerospora TaxID=78915 RepID=A0A4P9XH64_9FUNG|nr:Rad9-domain-containing protein [Thamnocephalis sphaerospora]|eukprot:RKP04520.1 Rad9-domain-containing protein [Thamnocephalis sphaerospora]